MTNPTPNIPRLRKLADAVESAPDELWDMDVWAMKTDCGTVGCAFGHYVMKNPDCGFRILFRSPIADLETSGGRPALRSSRAEHFGIDNDTEDRLFTPHTDLDQSRLAVLARIREVIARAEKEVRT